MRKKEKRIISLFMAVVLMIGMLAGTGIEAKAATNEYTFYLYCSACNRNVSGTAIINGQNCSTGSTIQLNVGSYYDVHIKTIEDGHLVETLKNCHAYANTDFFQPKVFHKQTVTVRVKDSAGKPLSGRTVVTNWNNTSGTTDSKGEYKFDTRSIWSVGVTVKDPYGDITKSQTASENGGVIEITVPDRRKVTVNLQAEDGTPISGSAYVDGAFASSTDTKGTYTAIVSDDKAVTISGASLGFGENSSSIGKDTNDTTVTLKLPLANPEIVIWGVFQPINSWTMSVGDSQTGLTVQNNINGYLFTEGTGGASYTWESDNTEVLKVSEGSIEGLSAGTANLKVTVKFGSLSKTTYIPVTVNKKDPAAFVTTPDLIYGEYQGTTVLKSDVPGKFSINGKTITVNANEEKKVAVSDVIDVAGNPKVDSYSLSYTFTPEDTNKYNVKSGTASYRVTEKDLSQADVVMPQEVKTYNGKEQSFEDIEVKLDGKTLVKDTDYSVSYVNNVNAGINTAKLIVEGKNNYTGKVEKTFSIQKKELGVANVTAKDRVYDSTNKVELLEVRLNGIEGHDDVCVDLTKASGLVEQKNAGSYGKITVDGFDLAGAAANNYKLPETVNGTEFYLDSDVKISEKIVTIQNVTVKDSKEYDGSTSAEITNAGNISAICGNDDVSIVKGTAVYSDKNHGEDKTVSFSGFSLTGKDAGNYVLQGQPESVTADISKKPLEVNVRVADKQYNGQKRETEVLFAEALNVISDDQVALNILNAEAVFTETGDANEEMNIPVSVKGIEITGKDAGNYSFPQPFEVDAKILNNYTAKANVDYTVNSNDWINTDFEVTAAEGKQISTLADGTYVESLSADAVDENGLGTLEFYVKDSNGDISKKVTEHYRIDKTSPTGAIKIEKNEWKSYLNKVSLGIFFNNYYDVKIDAFDQENLSGVKSVEYYEHKTTDTEEIGVDISSVTWTEGDSVAVSWEEANTYVYYAKITDCAGNVTYICSEEGIEYDKTFPVISGVKDGQVSYTTKHVSVSDRNLETVTVNGEIVESDFVLEGDVKETYTIVATDKAGNTTTVVVKMKTIASLKNEIDDLTKENVKISDEDKIKEIQKILENEDLTNATEEEKAQIESLEKKCDDLQKAIKAKKEALQEDAVKTGDSDSLYIWFILFVVSAFVIRRKRTEQY